MLPDIEFDRAVAEWIDRIENLANHHEDRRLLYDEGLFFSSGFGWNDDLEMFTVELLEGELD